MSEGTSRWYSSPKWVSRPGTQRQELVQMDRSYSRKLCGIWKLSARSRQLTSASLAIPSLDWRPGSKSRWTCSRCLSGQQTGVKLLEVQSSGNQSTSACDSLLGSESARHIGMQSVRVMNSGRTSSRISLPARVNFDSNYWRVYIAFNFLVIFKLNLLAQSCKLFLDLNFKTWLYFIDNCLSFF